MASPTSSPPSRPPTAHVYFSMPKSLCGTCKVPVDAQILFRDKQVSFDKEVWGKTVRPAASGTRIPLPAGPAST